LRNELAPMIAGMIDQGAAVMKTTLDRLATGRSIP
jgi:hypothetical protein